MSSIRGICFDLGGTLLANSSPGSGMCERIARTVGRPLVDLISPINRYLRCREGTVRDLAIEFCEAIGFREPDTLIRCALNRCDRYDLYPEVRNALAGLREYKLAVLSNCSAWECADLEKLGISAHFAAVLYSFSIGYAKPDPQMFRAAERAMGMTAEELILVGDSDSDITGARGAGWSSVYVSRAGPTRLASLSDWSVTDLQQLVSLLHESSQNLRSGC